MVVCKSVATSIEAVSAELGIELSAAQREQIGDGVEALLLDILADAERICNSNKRKTVSLDDIKQVLIQKKLPFASIIHKHQARSH